jgi:outer membrane protein OmpA-like peptidoglycan-associated protein
MKNAEKINQVLTGNVSGPSSPLFRLLEQLTVSRASELARSGCYNDAEVLLADGRHEARENPTILDLCARICAQQGRLLEAENYWTLASRLEPENVAYRAGLHRIAQVQRRPAWILFPLLPVLVSIVCVFIAIIIGRSYSDSLQALIVSGIRSEIAKLVEVQMQNLQKIRPHDLKLQASGASLKIEGNALIVSFNSGLFSHGVSLTPEAKAILTSIGRQLEPYVQNISVHVIGHTDNIPIPPGYAYLDNIALGMERASSVVNHLRATTKLPPRIFAISSFGEYLTPYPQDTHQNRSRNRTVMLRITK